MDDRTCLSATRGSHIILEFEKFVTTLRSATAHLSRGTTESEELMSEWLKIRFMKK